MKIATAKTKTSKRWRTEEISWPQFLHRIEEVYRTPETVREYKAMSKEARSTAKEIVGGFVGGALSSGQRKTENVISRSMVTLDADSAKPGAWVQATALCEYRMACYSTHSHTPEHPRLRWIVPTDREMTPDEYPAVARRVAQWLDIESIDPSTYDLCRLFYWPSCPKDGDYEYHQQEGPVLSVDEVLASYGCGDAWTDSTLWPIAKSEQEIRVRDMRKAGEPTEKPGLVGLFCRTYDVPAAIDAFLPEVYIPTDDPDRYTFAGGSGVAGAILYNDGAFLYSNHATDPCQGHSVNSFDLVRIHLFGDQDSDDELDVPVTKLPSYTAMCKWAADLPEIKRQMVAEREASAKEDFADLSGVEEDDTDWQAQLKVNHKTGECDPDVDNALLILLHDPQLRGKLAKDEFSGLPKLRGDVPWRKLTPAEKAPGRGASWTDEDDSGLVWYMQKAWNYSSEKNLMHALKIAFDRNAFHPVRDYLNGLTWDGTPRLETMFIRHLGAEDTKLTRAATRKWMCAAVKRVMVPGCKFDNCLVLVGPQNIGKSSFADVLSKGWFNDSDINMNSKDGYDSLRGSWIIELAELASTKRSDVETVKTFLSKREDTYRAAYTRHPKTYSRQCVFFGTTNEQEFLRDRTGNRRFWPITVSHKMNRDALEAEVDQLWAEAVVLYKKGENLWMDTPELESLLQGTLSSREVQDDLEGELLEYLDTKLPDNWDELTPESRRDFIQGDLPVDPEACSRRRDTVCVTEIKVELLGLDRRKKGGNDYDSRRVANLMNNLPGWKKSSHKVRVPLFGPQWVYYRNGTEPVEA